MRSQVRLVPRPPAQDCSVHSRVKWRADEIKQHEPTCPKRLLKFRKGQKTEVPQTSWEGEALPTNQRLPIPKIPTQKDEHVDQVPANGTHQEAYELSDLRSSSIALLPSLVPLPAIAPLPSTGPLPSLAPLPPIDALTLIASLPRVAALPSVASQLPTTPLLPPCSSFDPDQLAAKMTHTSVSEVLAYLAGDAEDLLINGKPMERQIAPEQPQQRLRIVNPVYRYNSTEAAPSCLAGRN